MDNTFVINNGYGKETVSIQVGQYPREYGGGIGIMLNCASDEAYGEPFGNLTTNLGEKLPPYYAYVDTNNMPGAEAFIKETGIGKPTGVISRSGYCVYPVYVFDKDKLMELDPEGMEQYHKGIASDKEKGKEPEVPDVREAENEGASDSYVP